jgi:HK97 family phage prohead protease
MLKINAFACPFNVENSFNETMLPGAFSRWLRELGSKTLPMFVQHEFPCGEWTRLEERKAGLYAEGYLTDPEVIDAVKDGVLPDLSINYRSDFNPDGSWNASRKRAAQWGVGSYPPGLHVYPRVSVPRVLNLSELSLVDQGAFPGTHYKALDVR